MILGTVESVNGVPIRLTDERWEHILDSRPYMRNYEADVLETIETPDLVLRAAGSVLVAVTAHGRNGFLHVVYREVSRRDGFVITAYFKDSYHRRQVLWRAND